MKIIIPLNQLAYELDDLSKEAREKALYSHIQFWFEVRPYKEKYKGNYEKAIDKAEDMGTPWFEADYVLAYCEKELVREIKSNKYLYNEKGEILPIKYYTNNGKLVKVTFTVGGVETEVQLKRYTKTVK